MGRKPRIGIVANILIMEAGIMPGLRRAYVNNDYVVSLEMAGCVPVMLPVITELTDVGEQLEGLDGAVLSGGWDSDPLLYGEQPIVQQGFTMGAVDRFSLAVMREGAARGIPMLGICKGMQIANVAFGGTLFQDIATQAGPCIQHMQQAPRFDPTQTVTTESGSFLASVLGERAVVNSLHHQSVRDVAEGFRITARAADGVIEGIERADGSFICGVQWHPEMMAQHGDETMLRLFQAFADACR